MRRLLVYLLLSLLAPRAALAGDLQDILAPLLEGEFALQQGDAGEAARAYVRAAELGDEPAVAERALRAALAARDAELASRALEIWQARMPAEPGLAVARLRIALLQGNADAAGVAMQALLARADGWREVAPALMTAPQAQLSGRVLGEALDAGQLPAELDGWLALGGVALRLDEKSLYRRLAEAAAQRFPDQPRALIWQAEELLAEQQREAARASLEAALKLPGLEIPDRLAVAANLNGLGDPAAAARVLADAGSDDRILAARAAYLAAADDDAGLRALYEQARAGVPAPESAPAHMLLLGQLAEMLEDAPAALAWYRQVAGGLAQERARLRIAVLLEKTGERDAARNLLREIQASDTEWGDIVRNAYLLEAELARAEKDAQTELSALDRGLAIFEDDPLLRYNRALARERLDQVEEAVADLRTLLASEPDDADWLNALGYTLVDRTDALEEGLELILKAIALKPDSAAIRDSLGWALHRLGRNDEALAHLRYAFSQQHDAEVAAHLGAVLAALGQLDEARSILRLAQEMEPDSRALRRVLDAIDLEPDPDPA